MVLLDRVTKKYNDLVVFKDLTLDIDEGKIYSILGPSGCGKTTILRIIGGLENIDSGRILLSKKRVSYIFQEHRLLPWKNVRKNLELVCPKEDLDKINMYLEMMELKDYEYSYPKDLSGGMKQRISMIRGFLYPHDILLMDEAFQALDLKLKTKLLREVYKLHKDIKNTIIFVTHNVEEALFLGDEIIVLSKKPAVILDKFKIDIPQEKRDFESKEIKNLKNKTKSLLEHTTV
ncbi:ABC transporter ATP-binding protein [Defluviitalea phaphyphila]|uniref:ABC transporter ATP-binding protein n=1 Tax=Defluviitalea phaphyphila TaxID=1473580 RepID=UPI000731DB65|nr:ABC transporter ATP-binding protein [Defluviitalea phaphyphila]